MKKFISMGFALLAAVTLAACGSTSSKDSSDKGAKTTASSKKKVVEFHKVGDSVTIDKVEYKLTGVTTTTERNEFEEKQPTNVIKVEYVVNNKSDEEVSVGMDLEAYGPDGKKLETYANTNTMDSVAAGKSIDAVEHFGIEKLGEVELQFSPLADFSGKAAKFKVNVQ